MKVRAYVLFVAVALLAVSAGTKNAKPTVGKVNNHKKKALGFRTKCFLFVVICHFRQYLCRSVSKVPAMKLSHCHKFWFIDRQVYVK